jgi:hypothetical protein
MDLFQAAKVYAPVVLRRLSGKREAEQLAHNTFNYENYPANTTWNTIALNALVTYSTNHPQFTIEDFKFWAYHKGLVEPGAPGAWGSVVQKAQKDGAIWSPDSKEGWVKSKARTQHGKLVRLWFSHRCDPQSPAEGQAE